MALTLKIGRLAFPRSLQTQIRQRDRRESWVALNQTELSSLMEPNAHDLNNEGPPGTLDFGDRRNPME
jgi:hypothetical protein